MSWNKSRKGSQSSMSNADQDEEEESVDPHNSEPQLSNTSKLNKQDEDDILSSLEKSSDMDVPPELEDAAKFREDLSQTQEAGNSVVEGKSLSEQKTAQKRSIKISQTNVPEDQSTKLQNQDEDLNVEEGLKSSAKQTTAQELSNVNSQFTTKTPNPSHQDSLAENNDGTLNVEGEEASTISLNKVLQVSKYPATNQEPPSVSILKSAHQSESEQVGSTSRVESSALQNQPSRDMSTPQETTKTQILSQQASERSQNKTKSQELENQYEELMGGEITAHTLSQLSEIPTLKTSAQGEVVSVDALRDMPSTSKHENNVLQSYTSASNNHPSASGGITNPIEDGSEYDEYHISPEDIFSEIKVARNEIQDDEHAHNLHSFVISKTFSSENVVVLLNLRRMKDGEWVLDKTIAQGLKPETYGGVVSIDQYDFDNDEKNPQGSKKPSQPDRPALKSQIPEEDDQQNSGNQNNNNIENILKRLEEYVNQVNKDIKAARDIVRNAPMCRNGAGVPTDPFCCSPCGPSTFDELSFVDKIVKMFHLVMEEDEPCNLCDKSKTMLDSQSNPVVSNWLQSLINEISKFCSNMSGNTELAKASAAAIIAMQSQAILEEVKNSGLLNKLSKSKLENLQLVGTSNNTQSRPPGPSRSAGSAGGSSGYEADGELSSNEVAANAAKQRKSQRSHQSTEIGQIHISNETNDDDDTSAAQDRRSFKRRDT